MVNKNFHIIQNIPSTIKTKSQREEKKIVIQNLHNLGNNETL